MNRLVLLGKDHSDYGAYHLAAAGASIGVLSVGGDRRSPSRQFKGDAAVPNEDALLILDDGARALVAIADAHFGHESSQGFIEALAGLDAVPSGPKALRSALAGLAAPHPGSASETTLLLAVIDRATGAGFGLTWGDSSLIALEPGGLEGRRLNPRNHRYVTPWRGGPALLHAAEAFDFKAGPGAWILAATDGVDECHYRHPESSVSLGHMARLRGDDAGPESYARALAELALAGVDGHPGGQDNIALALIPL